MDKIWRAYQQNAQARNVSPAEKRDTTAISALSTEISKLQNNNVVTRTNAPMVVSPLQVAQNGDIAISRQRHLATTVAEAPESGNQKRRIQLSAEGPRRSLLESIGSIAGQADINLLMQILERSAADARAPSTSSAYSTENEARRQWIRSAHLPLSEESSILYMADRSQSVGSASMAKISAAYKLASSGWSETGAQIVSDLIKSKRRLEVSSRSQQPQVDGTVVQKIIDGLQQEHKSERDTLLVLISYAALLRASEASELLWDDIRQRENLLEVRIRHAKNDQLGVGRSTFIACKEGSDLDCLLKRLKTRRSFQKTQSNYIFTNINNNQKLTSSAISTIVKRKLAEVGVTASHHALRRGCANDLLKKGLTPGEIQTRGRWRSATGLGRYLTDTPEAQGFKITGTTVEVEELDEEEEGEPPVLTRET